MKNITYINAGAGSGKTYTLTKILADKLSEMDNNGNSVLLPSQVILTTFTELAASEFREKARQKILEAGNLDAAAQIDSATIGTVHSVALHFIKKFWYLLDYGADIQIISERDADFYMSQSLARIVSERGEDSQLKKQKELKAFRQFRDYYDIVDGFSHPDYLFWQRHLKDIVEKMEYYDVDDVEESIKRCVETVRAIFIKPSSDLVFIAEALAEYRNFCATMPRQSDKSRKMVSMIEILLSTGEAYRDHSWLLDVKETMKGDNLASETTAAKQCANFTALLNALDDISVSEDNAPIIEAYIEAVFRLAKEWRDDYIAYKKTNHIISYNDMERLFLHLITDEPEVKDYIRDNYRLVMVDEFQDSNPIQLKIFNRLSELIAPANGHSYWVGDPKQAIYGFRGADTDLVNSVSRHFKFYDDAEIHPEEGDNHLGSGRLVESWRSRAKLVNLVNAVFADKFQHQDANGNTVHDIDPLCITLTPHFSEDDLGSCALEHWHNERIGMQKSFNPDALALKVKGLLDSGIHVHSGARKEGATKIRPKDIAILCRKNSAIKPIVKSLRKLNIPVSESEDAIMQRIEVQLVVSLLQFVQNPGNKHVIADLMRLLWGNTTEKILRDRIDYIWAKDKDGKYTHFAEDGTLTEDNWKEDADCVKEIIRQTEKFKHLSIPEMVRGIIYECNLPALVARWGDQHIRQQNLSAVQHLADDYDQMCLQMGLGTSISGFIYYLNTIEPDKERDNQSDTVKVFTYHGSKGLEWPIVIMNGLNEDTLNDSELIKKSFMSVREVVLNDNATEQDPFAKEYYLHFFPNIIKGKSKPAQSMTDIITGLDFYKRLKERTKGEECRLLYVGMTRAKDCLYTLGIDDRFAWLTNVGLQDCSRDNVWGLPEFASTRIDVTTPANGQLETDGQTYTMVDKPQMHTEYGDRYLSPSKIEAFEGYSAYTPWQEKGTEMDSHGWGNDYAAIGSCIHDIFAAYRKDDKEHNRNVAINTIGGYGVADKLAGHVDAIMRSADWLYEQLQAKYPQQEGDKTERELPFMLTLADGRTMRGEMDLLWHYSDAAGKHAILIDYKTYQGVALGEHTQTHYAQLSAYAKALKDAQVDVTHALIYYPVHGTVHELL